MSALNASPLHLISAIINLPQFHQDIMHVPHEITVQCIRLLITLSEDEEYAYKSNVEMVSFLAKSVKSLDDELYIKMNHYFIKRLLNVIHPQDPIWGAIAFVMASVAEVFTTYKEKEAWKRLCAVMFDVLRKNQIISTETAQRILQDRSHNNIKQKDEAWELEKALSKKTDPAPNHSIIDQYSSVMGGKVSTSISSETHTQDKDKDLHLLSQQSKESPVSKDLDTLSSYVFDKRFEYKK